MLSAQINNTPQPADKTLIDNMQETLLLATNYMSNPGHYQSICTERFQQAKYAEILIFLANTDNSIIKAITPPRLQQYAPVQIKQQIRNAIVALLFTPEANPEQILGLPIGADKTSIEKRYSTLMRLANDDQFTQPWPNEVLAQIKTAYLRLIASKRHLSLTPHISLPAKPPKSRKKQRQKFEFNLTFITLLTAIAALIFSLWVQFQNQTIKPPVPNLPNLPELEQLLNNFSRYYQTGDILRFTQLFTENAITTENTSRQAIRKDYETLFQVTINRSIKIEQVNWTINLSEAIGTGRFIVLLQTKQNTKPKEISGTISMTVNKVDQHPKISGLFYHYTNSSNVN